MHVCADSWHRVEGAQQPEQFRDWDDPVAATPIAPAPHINVFGSKIAQARGLDVLSVMHGHDENI